MTTPQQRYAIKNRDKILEYKRKKYKECKIIECECGVKYNEHGKHRHINSKNHINFINGEHLIYGRVYKIVSEHTDLVYVGRTTKKLQARLKAHIRDYKHKPHKNISSYELIKLNDCKIVELKKCYDLDDLKKTEYKYITELNTVNKLKSGMNKKIQKQISDKKYKDKLREKYNCECGSIVSLLCKKKHERTKKHLAFLKK